VDIEYSDQSTKFLVEITGIIVINEELKSNINFYYRYKVDKQTGRAVLIERYLKIKS